MKRHFTRYCFIALMAVVSMSLLGVTAHRIDKDFRKQKSHMHIHFKAEGGIAFIPGLSQPAELDSEDLSMQELEELQQRIAEARFFELPGKLGSPPPGAADYRVYTVTVEEDGHRHSVQFTDLVDNPALKKLFELLESLRQKRR